MENINNQLQHIQNNNELDLSLNDNGRFIHNPKPIKDINTLVNHYDITTEQIESSDLSKEHKEVLLATIKFPHISSLNIQQYDGTYNSLVGIFAKTIVESGFNIKEEEQEILISLFIDEIKNEFSYLTVEDVRIAVKKGVRLDYGKFFGINITTLNFWLKEYITSTKKDSMKSLPKIAPKNEYSGLNDSQRSVMRKEWLNSWIELFEKYHEGENVTISDAGNVFYKYCFANKIGSLTDSEKITLENKAKRLVISNEKERATSSIQIKEVNNIINSINANKYNNDTELKIMSEAKRLAIFLFFDKLISEKIELKDLIYKIESF